MQKLPDTELEIMQVIWKENRVLSTSEIKEKLEMNRPWNVSALQTLLNRLIERGLDVYKRQLQSGRLSCHLHQCGKGHRHRGTAKSIGE